MTPIKDDVQALRASGLTVSTFSNGNGWNVVVESYKLPVDLYDQPTVDILIQIPEAYPQAKLDMFWLYPTTRLASGELAKRTEHMESHLDRKWQRWSRHYAWDPQRHSLLTHFEAIEQALMEPNK